MLPWSTFQYSKVALPEFPVEECRLTQIYYIEVCLTLYSYIYYFIYIDGVL